MNISFSFPINKIVKKKVLMQEFFLKNIEFFLIKSLKMAFIDNY
jgi:hypothetical protein